jgi:hypothetical protein
MLFLREHSPHTDCVRLSESSSRDGCYGFIAQSSRLGDNTNLPLLEEWKWLKPAATSFVGVDHTGSVKGPPVASPTASVGFETPLACHG